MVTEPYPVKQRLDLEQLLRFLFSLHIIDVQTVLETNGAIWKDLMVE